MSCVHNVSGGSKPLYSAGNTGNANNNKPKTNFNKLKHQGKSERKTYEMTEEKKKLLAKGKCFKCKQAGHLAKDCPKSNTISIPVGSSSIGIDFDALERNREIASSTNFVSLNCVGMVDICTQTGVSLSAIRHEPQTEVNKQSASTYNRRNEWAVHEFGDEQYTDLLLYGLTACLHMLDAYPFDWKCSKFARRSGDVRFMLHRETWTHIRVKDRWDDT